MNETHILIRLLRMYIPRNWEFGSALAAVVAAAAMAASVVAAVPAAA
jgi:hypothetical protein